MNALELEFLFSVNFSLHVTTELFEKYYSELANHMGVGYARIAAADSLTILTLARVAAGGRAA